jgi:hypothetical protein
MSLPRFIILLEHQDPESGWFEYESTAEADEAARTLADGNPNRGVRIYEAVRELKVIPSPRLTVTHLREPKAKAQAES